jgi:hypothetical protein
LNNRENKNFNLHKQEYKHNISSYPSAHFRAFFAPFATFGATKVVGKHGFTPLNQSCEAYLQPFLAL